MAVVSFRRNHVALLEMFLAKECQVPSARRVCEEQGKTCGLAGQCIDVERPELPDLLQDADFDAASGQDMQRSDGTAMPQIDARNADAVTADAAFNYRVDPSDIRTLAVHGSSDAGS